MVTVMANFITVKEKLYGEFCSAKKKHFILKSSVLLVIYLLRYSSANINLRSEFFLKL